MQPDMSGVLDEWFQLVTIKTVTQQTTDFDRDDIIAGRQQDCVIQPAQRESINPDTVDWSKRYIQFHTKLAIAIDEYIEYKGEDYKVIDVGPYDDYGYIDGVAEQTKKPLLVPNV